MLNELLYMKSCLVWLYARIRDSVAHCALYTAAGRMCSCSQCFLLWWSCCRGAQEWSFLSCFRLICAKHVHTSALAYVYEVDSLTTYADQGSLSMTKCIRLMLMYTHDGASVLYYQEQTAKVPSAAHELIHVGLPGFMFGSIQDCVLILFLEMPLL